MSIHKHSQPDMLSGRFVIRFDDSTQTGLAVHEVLEYWADAKTPVRDVFQIHRVDEAGRMELIGVAEADLKIPGGILLVRETVKDAREVYDDLLASAPDATPPCRIDMRLVRLAAPTSRFAVALLFPAACTDAVARWLVRQDIAADKMIAGSEAVAAYHDGAPNDILSTTLES